MLEELERINAEIANVRFRMSKAPELTDAVKEEIKYLIYIEERIRRWIDETKEQISVFIGEN